jgi:Domain of unknown function (DUF4184)
MAHLSRPGRGYGAGVPATVPSHPAAVLPLKIAYPHRFDGVALVIGSGAPDVMYAVESLGLRVPSHTWHAQFWWNLPVTLVLVWLGRRAAPFVAAHLPACGPLALRDYGVLAHVRHPLRVTVWSALLGAFSHVVWDTLTHPFILLFGGVRHLPVLHATAVAGLPWWRVIHLASEIVGTAVAVAVIVHIGRRHMLLAWHGPIPDVPRRPALFWSVAGGVGAALLAVVALLPGNGDGPHVIGVRVLGAVSLALLAAAAAAAMATAVVREPQTTQR